MTGNSSAPAPIPTPRKTKQTAIAEARSTSPPLSVSTTMSPMTPSSESMMPPHPVLPPLQTGYEIPAPVSDLPSRSPTETPVNLADPGQDRDQCVRSQGQEDGAGAVHVREDKPEEVHRHDEPTE